MPDAAQVEQLHWVFAHLQIHHALELQPWVSQSEISEDRIDYCLFEYKEIHRKKYVDNLAILCDDTKWECMEAKMRDKDGRHLGTLIMKAYAYDAEASDALWPRFSSRFSIQNCYQQQFMTTS